MVDGHSTQWWLRCILWPLAIIFCHIINNWLLWAMTLSHQPSSSIIIHLHSSSLIHHPSPKITNHHGFTINHPWPPSPWPASRSRRIACTLNRLPCSAWITSSVTVGATAALGSSLPCGFTVPRCGFDVAWCWLVLAISEAYGAKQFIGYKRKFQRTTRSSVGKQRAEHLERPQKLPQ